MNEPTQHEVLRVAAVGNVAIEFRIVHRFDSCAKYRVSALELFDQLTERDAVDAREIFLQRDLEQLVVQSSIDDADPRAEMREQFRNRARAVDRMRVRTHVV